MRSLVAHVAAAALFAPLAADAQTAPAGRETEFEMIAGYQPVSDVRDESLLDLDVAEMQSYLQQSKPPSFKQAKHIYLHGKNSGGYAEIDCTGLASALAEGTQVKQAGNAGATGYVQAPVGKGAKHLKVMYTSSCRAGGTGKKDVSGCFTAPGGSLTVDGKDIGMPITVQNKYRTLAGCSTTAYSKMAGHEYYSIYRAYYDHRDYAHRLVLDALNGAGSCSTCDLDARTEIAGKAPVLLNLWMYVIHKLEKAIMHCQKGCKSKKCNHDSVHAWESAVAVYSGSREGPSGSDSGKLLHHVAGKLCNHFGTCGSKETDVNLKILDLFKKGQSKLAGGHCVTLVGIKRAIANLMLVPLVQGSLLSAHEVANSKDGSKKKALGAIFSAAVLPRVAVCNAAAAKTISENCDYDSLKPVGSRFAAVKAAFESTYECLGISCEVVGGLVLSGSKNKFHDGAKPCVTANKGGVAPPKNGCDNGDKGVSPSTVNYQAPPPPKPVPPKHGKSGGHFLGGLPDCESSRGTDTGRQPECNGNGSGRTDLIIVIVVISVLACAAIVAAIVFYLKARRFQQLFEEEKKKGSGALPATTFGGRENNA